VLYMFLRTWYDGISPSSLGWRCLATSACAGTIASRSNDALRTHLTRNDPVVPPIALSVAASLEFTSPCKPHRIRIPMIASFRIEEHLPSHIVLQVLYVEGVSASPSADSDHCSAVSEISPLRITMASESDQSDTPAFVHSTRNAHPSTLVLDEWVHSIMARSISLAKHNWIDDPYKKTRQSHGLVHNQTR
jgi:hypothetical protein